MGKYVYIYCNSALISRALYASAYRDVLLTVPLGKEGEFNVCLFLYSQIAIVSVAYTRHNRGLGDTASKFFLSTI
jgi:hypothetical protein